MVPGEGRAGAVPGCAGRPGQAEQPRAHPPPPVPALCGQRGWCCHCRGGNHQVSAVGQSPGSLSTQGFPGKPGKEPGQAGGCQFHPRGSHPLKIRQVMLPCSPQSQHNPQVPWTWCRALISSPKKHHTPPKHWCALPACFSCLLSPACAVSGNGMCIPNLNTPQIQLPASSPSLSGDTGSSIPRAQVAQSQHRLWQCQCHGAAPELLWCGQMVSEQRQSWPCWELTAAFSLQPCRPGCPAARGWV